MSVQANYTPIKYSWFDFDVGWTILYLLLSKESLYKVAWPGYTRVKNS